MAGISVSTLGDVREHNHTLYAHCTAKFSGHGAPLDIDALIVRFGADYVFVNDKRIGAACVCTQCGHRGAMITLQPPT